MKQYVLAIFVRNVSFWNSFVDLYARWCIEVTRDMQWTWANVARNIAVYARHCESTTSRLMRNLSSLIASTAGDRKSALSAFHYYKKFYLYEGIRVCTVNREKFNNNNFQACISDID